MSRRTTATRLVALALQRLHAVDELAVTDAEAYLARALDEVRELRREHHLEHAARREREG